MDAEIVSLSAKLAEAAIRNTASAIADKIAAVKAKRKEQETVAVLEEIVNDLISDKNDLVRIAQVYEQKLAAQRISEDDIRYITQNIVPLVEILAANSNNKDGQTEENQETGGQTPETIVEMVRSLLSVETISILQLIGFNFKEAIGQPLTELAAAFISSKVPTDNNRLIALQEKIAQRDIAMYTTLNDQDSYARFQDMRDHAVFGGQS
jgi:hypothetical protein